MARSLLPLRLLVAMLLIALFWFAIMFMYLDDLMTDNHDHDKEKHPNVKITSHESTHLNSGKIGQHHSNRLKRLRSRARRLPENWREHHKKLMASLADPNLRFHPKNLSLPTRNVKGEKTETVTNATNPVLPGMSKDKQADKKEPHVIAKFTDNAKERDNQARKTRKAKSKIKRKKGDSMGKAADAIHTNKSPANASSKVTSGKIILVCPVAPCFQFLSIPSRLLVRKQ